MTSAEILSLKISWQAPYLVRLEGDLTRSARALEAMRITDAMHSVWQAQYLVKVECDPCCSVHWK